MAFYTYDQNNSGGGYDDDAKAGLAHRVIVEANDTYEADQIAERIGIYFDEDFRTDCPCCGTRWSPAWGAGDPVPSIYGQDVSTGVFSSSWPSWTTVEAYIHYKDGRVVPVTAQTSEEA